MNRGPSPIRPPRPTQHPEPTGPPPVVIGQVSNDGHNVTVTCPFCRKRHEHGTPELEDDRTTMKLIGYRLSHCTDRPRSSYRIVGRLGS